MTYEDKPWNKRIPENTPPGMPVKVPDECPVCGDFTFAGWQIEARCRCGAIFQIKPTTENNWEDVPRCKVKEEYIEPMKEYWEQTERKRVCIDDLNKWIKNNYPEL